MVKQVLESNGFTQTEGHDWNIMWGAGIIKQNYYDDLKPFQKLNHFPSSFELSRKDCFCKNIVRMKERFPQYNLFPESFVLPDELPDFYQTYYQYEEEIKRKNLQNPDTKAHNIWIVKPNASSQGKGIYVTDSFPLEEQCVVS